MISDDPDEDADALDDDHLLTEFLDPSSPQTEPEATAQVMDWPPHGSPDVGANLDAPTLAWFKANHADWQGAIRSVLKSWVAARTRSAGGDPVLH
jgi:hypothetical protein